MIFYNDIDPDVCGWLEQLIGDGLLPPGDVVCASVSDLDPARLEHYTQWHLFAGIGGWPHALALAGVPTTRRVMTASLPCQPFSSAGQQKGMKDDRHLWPDTLRLIEHLRPCEVYGEQVASALAVGRISKRAGSDAEPAWLDTVFADLEAAHYTCGARIFPAASIGAPHIRDRTYWMGYTNGARAEAGVSKQAQGDEGLASIPDHGSRGRAGPAHGSKSSRLGGLADSDGERQPALPVSGVDDTERDAEPRGIEGRLADTGCATDERLGRPGEAPGPARTAQGQAQQRQRGGSADRPGVPSSGLADARGAGTTHGGWEAADWLYCRDGKWRPVEPGTFPLADGLPRGVVPVSGPLHPQEARRLRLKGYGNAIVPEQAARFIIACDQARSALDLC